MFHPQSLIISNLQSEHNVAIFYFGNCTKTLKCCCDCRNGHAYKPRMSKAFIVRKKKTKEKKIADNPSRPETILIWTSKSVRSEDEMMNSVIMHVCAHSVRQLLLNCWVSVNRMCTHAKISFPCFIQLLQKTYTPNIPAMLGGQF